MDIGTGDGRFVYQMAQKNPDKFYIGIDPAQEPLRKISEKIYRNEKHGGVKNALFIKASVENLPDELCGVADEVHIHFPWGSLLGAMLTGEAGPLLQLRKICKAGSLLELIASIDRSRDNTQIEKQQIEIPTKDFAETTLQSRYFSAGFEIKEHGLIDSGKWPDLCTSWASKLKNSGNRKIFYLIAEAVTKANS